MLLIISPENMYLNKDRLIIVITVALLLNGCAEYKWVKDGSSDVEAHKTLIGCKARSLKDLPPDNVVYRDSSSGYESKKDKKKNKEITDYKLETNYQIDDANSYSREILISDCMLSKGWTEIRIN